MKHRHQRRSAARLAVAGVPRALRGTVAALMLLLCTAASSQEPPPAGEAPAAEEAAAAQPAPPAAGTASAEASAAAEQAPPAAEPARGADIAPDAASAPPANAAPAVEPATMTAETAPLAVRSLILDIADGANRAIAVGERGHILVSESRRDWRQVENVPTRSTLTSVTAVGDKAWAVGHDGVILASGDGGLTWTRQRAQPYDPTIDDVHNGVPLLDVWFADAQNGIAIGAYALMLKTSDGGATWTPHAILGAPAAAPDAAAEADAGGDEAAAGDADGGDATGDAWTFSDEDLELEEETEPHLNAIARTGDGSLFIVAERGAAFRSTDGGESWQRITLPYEGSMFGVIGYDGRHVLAYGLRGHAFESMDLGDHWTEVETGTELSLFGGTGWTGGGAALVGANGIVLTRSAAGSGLLAHTHPDGVVLSSVIALSPDGELVVAGENGVSLFQLKR